MVDKAVRVGKPADWDWGFAVEFVVGRGKVVVVRLQPPLLHYPQLTVIDPEYLLHRHSDIPANLATCIPDHHLYQKDLQRQKTLTCLLSIPGEVKVGLDSAVGVEDLGVERRVWEVPWAVL